jgi:meso-butanediol dehydrogenase/(S,S)-butanediol dehydrogenase/diacetyl reductase
MSLEGQVAMVTGSGRGIGKAIALRLAGEGGDIGIVEIDPETAGATAEEIRRLGRRAVATVADVTDPFAAEASVKTSPSLAGSTCW